MWLDLRRRQSRLDTGCHARYPLLGMRHIFYLGTLDRQALDLAAAVSGSGAGFSCATQLPDLNPGMHVQLVAGLGAQSPPLAVLGPALAARRWQWLAWNRNDDPALGIAAYQAGATAVLPGATPPELILHRLDAHSDEALADMPAAAAPLRKHWYQRGEQIAPESNTVLAVGSGIVAISMVHADGTEVLLGLCGPGQTLVGHPHDACSLQLRAHTDAEISFSSWEGACALADFPLRLRLRMQQMEAWAAMQARPHLDQRIMGLLALLAEQFGEAHASGHLVNVRITHAQLASAVGATRTTITRTLGDLRTRGELVQVGKGEAERFCLTAAPAHAPHLPRN